MENGKLLKFFQNMAFFVSISFTYFKLYSLSMEFRSNEVLDTADFFFAENF